MKKLIAILAVAIITAGAMAQSETKAGTKERKSKARQECCKRNAKAVAGSSAEDWFISPVKGKCPQCTTPVMKEGSLLCKYEPESCKKCSKKKM